MMARSPSAPQGAAGAAVFLHVNSPMIAAEGGGSLGVAGTGQNNAKFTTAVGWAIKLHTVSALAPIKNGTIGTAVTSLNGVNQKNTHPMDFVVSYTPGRLSITVTQDGNTATLSQAVDLTDATGLSLEDFELVTETKPPVRLRLTNGILTAIHNTGTAIFVR